MMNLRNMVQGLKSDAVALELIAHWEHDQGTLKFWRASSTFVYAVKRKRKTYFLRFSFEQETPLEQIEAELQFMQYLHRHGFPCVTPLPSVNGRLIESVQLPQGRYYGALFSKADGVPLYEVDELPCEAWGRSLASLHALSQAYEPTGGRRRSWREALLSAENVLHRHPHENEAMAELARVKAWLESMPAAEEAYGLIHYDFQTDNVFWKEKSGQLSVIDFDDSMYHWFAMDIAAALTDQLEDESPEGEAQLQAFVRGYRSVRPLDEAMVQAFPRFRRFAELYSFARLLASLENSELEEAPEWLDGLKAELRQYCDEMRRGFAKPW
ncbi:phosphotransferase enzyme family protein [Paenibacillus elgii]|uniref:phosphotransferase enzyme family protein n=1 Tax=Paenibacillus elgii TaxID=189691 RepID=UPI00204221CC|nr:phosphotransferase [Paenibacillus elgii]MCM3273551.1 phosphotransferase [Paenibacillus elgii]